MPEKTLDRCHCGDPLFEKVAADGATVYVACHHCDRPCDVGVKGGCPRCIASQEWKPNYDEKE